MAVAMMVDNPEGAQQMYDRVRERLGMENATGGIFHIAGPSPNGGWRVIEVWESEEDAKRFVKERMLPAFEALGAYRGRRLRPRSHVDACRLGTTHRSTHKERCLPMDTLT